MIQASQTSVNPLTEATQNESRHNLKALFLNKFTFKYQYHYVQNSTNSMLYRVYNHYNFTVPPRTKLYYNHSKINLQLF